MPETEELEQDEEFIRQLICKNLRKLNRNICKLLKIKDESLALHVHNLESHVIVQSVIEASREWIRWLDSLRQADSIFVWMRVSFDRFNVGSVAIFALGNAILYER
jgi:hypothetical protein